jgi:hypothetical protein
LVFAKQEKCIFERMKRLLAGIFLILYLAVYAVGMPLTFHYCEGSLENISIITATEEDCCGELDDKGCCSSEEAYIKAETNHPPVLNKIEVPQASLLFLSTGFLTIPAYQSQVNNQSSEYLSPYPEGPPLNYKWLVDCVIRL